MSQCETGIEFPNGTPASHPSGVPVGHVERLEQLLREAFNAMDEVRCTLIDRADPSGISSVLAMTLADVQRDIKAAGYGPHSGGCSNEAPAK